jgi:hypothetical protein
MKVTYFTPLEIHSNPKEPTPENRSNTYDFSKSILNLLECFKILNIDSFVKSLSGLVELSKGYKIFLPLKIPDIILINQ